ncbi:hypothetical protein ABZX72_35560 [Streptomyces cyaneofuscatus]|uniref:hypothetical protein n=1 Tax=Streptomyces cyaneofuscatus TaxID=66883 RepID=UPI0033BAAD86
MTFDDATARLWALPIPVLGPLPPPFGLDLSAEWQITAGKVTEESVNWDEIEILNARSEAGLFVSGEEIARHRTVTHLLCPACGEGRDLCFLGHWGSPPDLLCTCGHRWTPWSDSPQYGTWRMMHVITEAFHQRQSPRA